MANYPQIPNVLTKADWEKKKGALTKPIKTGITDAMENLKKVHAGVDWVKCAPADTYKTEADVDKAIQDFKDNMSQLPPITAAAYKLRDVAKLAAATYGKKMLIPKSSVAAATAVQTAADHFGVEVKSFDPHDKFEAARKRVQERVAKGRNEIKGYFPKIEKGISTIGGKPTPTFEEWQSFWSDDLRGLQAAVAVIPELKEHVPIWRTICSQAFVGEASKLKAADIKTKVGQVKIAYDKLKAAVK